MVQLKKRMEVTEEGMTKVRNHPLDGAHPQQGTSHAAASLLLGCWLAGPALQSVTAACAPCRILPYTGSCPMPCAALHGVLLGGASCPVRHPGLQCPAPCSGLFYTSTLPYMVSWLMPRTALHDVLLWVASCTAPCPALHGVLPYTVSCPAQGPATCSAHAVISPILYGTLRSVPPDTASCAHSVLP